MQGQNKYTGKWRDNTTSYLLLITKHHKKFYYTVFAAILCKFHKV